MSDGNTAATYLGFWAWGVATVVLGVAVFGFLIWAAFTMNPNGTFNGPRKERLQAIYTVLKDHSSIIAAAMAAGALAWSFFFATIYKIK